MSPCDCCLFHVLWITLQMLLALAGPYSVVAMAHFAPYVSEFTYAPDFHPSQNPKCPTRWTRDVDKDKGDPHVDESWNRRRSPEEGLPVGQEPSIEIRAVLVRCPKSHEETINVPLYGSSYNITAGRSQDILEFHGFDRDEPTHHSEVRDCRRKLIVTMKFNNIGKTKTQEEFVVIDHVLDPVTMHKARLLNPFVVKVRQEPVLQLYGLRFQSVVNGEAKEEVINKKLANYTGCESGLKNPTCGQMLFHGNPIPYSQGFCCSCDPEVNTERQPSLKLKHPTEKSFSNAFSSMKPPCNNIRSKSHDNLNVRSVFENLFQDERSSGGSEKKMFDKKSSKLIRKANHKKRDQEKQRLQDNLSSADSISKDADKYISKFVASQSHKSRGQKDIVNKKYEGSESMENKSVPSLEKNRVKFKGELGPTLGGQSFSRDFQDEDSLRNGKVARGKGSPEYLDEVMSPILQSALIANTETKGKIEPYIDAVARQALDERSVYSKWRDKKKSINPDRAESKDVDRDIIGEFEKSDKDSFLNHRPIAKETIQKKPLISSKNVNVTSELLKLEEEYEAFKKMSRRRAAPGGGGGLRSMSENDAKSLAEVTNGAQEYSRVKKQPLAREHSAKVTRYNGSASDSNGGKFEKSHSTLSRPGTDTAGQVDGRSGNTGSGLSSGLRSDEISGRSVSKDSARVPLGYLVHRNSQGQQGGSSSALSISSEIPSTRIKVPVSVRNSYRIGSYVGRAATQLYPRSMDSSGKSDEIEYSTRVSEITTNVSTKATSEARGSLAVKDAKLNSSNSTGKPSTTFLMQSTTEQNTHLAIPLILRQELANDTLYPMSTNNVAETNGSYYVQKVNKSKGESDKKLDEDMMELLARIIEADEGTKKANDSYQRNHELPNGTDYEVGKGAENINGSRSVDQDELIENLLRMALNERESLKQEKSMTKGIPLRKLNKESNYTRKREGENFEFFENVQTDIALSKFMPSSTEKIKSEESVALGNVSKVSWKDQRLIKDPSLARLNYSSLITAGTNRHFEESNQKDSPNTLTRELRECSEKSSVKSSGTLKNIWRDITRTQSSSAVARNSQVSGKRLESVYQTLVRPRRIFVPVEPEVEFIDGISRIENREQSALGRLVNSGESSGLVSGPAETIRLSAEGHLEDPRVEKLSCKEQRDKSKVNSREESRGEHYRDTLVATNLGSYVDLGTLEDWPKGPRKRSLWSEKAKRHESRSYADDLGDPEVESAAIEKGNDVPDKTNDRDSEEPVTVLSAGFDLVKGNLHYEDQSATVINEHRLEETSVFTEQDYIFLDENGRERAATEPRLEEQRDRLREQALRKYLKGSGEKMEAKEDQENKQRSLYSMDSPLYPSPDQNFQTDERYPKRNFRSVSYEDPLDDRENESEMKIDKKIDEKFVEISKALKEASDDVKLVNQNAKKKISRNDHSIFRNFAVALNGIPKVNYFQKSNEEAKVHSNFRELESGQRESLISYPPDGYRIHYVQFPEKPQRKTKPFFSHANPNQTISASIANLNESVAGSTKAQLSGPTLSSTKTRNCKTSIRPSMTFKANSLRGAIKQITRRPPVYSQEAFQRTYSTLFTSPSLRMRISLDIPDVGRKYDDHHNTRVTESSIDIMNNKNSEINSKEASRNITMGDTSKIYHEKYGTSGNKKFSSGILPKLIDINRQEEILPTDKTILQQNVTSALVTKANLGNEFTVRNVTRALLTAVRGQEDTIRYTVSKSTLLEETSISTNTVNRKEMIKSRDIIDTVSIKPPVLIQDRDSRIRHNRPFFIAGPQTGNIIKTENIGSEPIDIKILLMDQSPGIKLSPQVSKKSITNSRENTINSKSPDSSIPYPSDKSHKTIFPKSNKDRSIYREIGNDPDTRSKSRASNFDERQPEIEDDKIVIQRLLLDIKPEGLEIDDEEIQERETGSGFNGSFTKNDIPAIAYIDTSKMAHELISPSNFVHNGQKVSDVNVKNKLTDTVSQRREEMKEGLTWARVAESGFLDPGMKTSSTYPGSQLGSSITKGILYSTSPGTRTLTTTRTTSPGVFIASGKTFLKNSSYRIPLHIRAKAPRKRSSPDSESYYSVDMCNQRAELNSVDPENSKISTGSSLPENITIATTSGNMEDPNVYLRKYKFPQAVREALVRKLKGSDVLEGYFNPKKLKHNGIINVNSLEDADDSDFVKVQNYTNLKNPKRSISTRAKICNQDDNEDSVMGDTEDTSYRNTGDYASISHTSYLGLPVIRISGEKGRAVDVDSKLKGTQQRATAIIKSVNAVQESFDVSRLKRDDDSGNFIVTGIPVKENAKILSGISTSFTSNIFDGTDDPVVSVREHPVFLRNEADRSAEDVGKETSENVGIKTRRFLQASQIPRKSCKRRTHSERMVYSGKKDNGHRKKRLVHSRVYRDAGYSLSGNNDLDDGTVTVFGNSAGLHARNQRLDVERFKKRFLLLGRKALGNKTRNDALTFYDYDYYPQEVGTLYKKKLEEPRITERKSNSMGKTIVTTDDGVSNLVGTEADYKLESARDEWKSSGKRTGIRNQNRENLRGEFKLSHKTIGTTDDGISNLAGTSEIIDSEQEVRETLNSKRRNRRKTRENYEETITNFGSSGKFSKIVSKDGNTNFDCRTKGNKGRKIVTRCGDSRQSKFLKHKNNESWRAKMELLKLKKHADILKEYLNWSRDVVTPEYLFPTDITLNEEKISDNDNDTVIGNGSDSPSNVKSSNGIIINFAIAPANFSAGIGIDISNTLSTLSIDEVKNPKFLENRNYENTTIELSVLEEPANHFSPQKLETTSKCLGETKTEPSSYDDECSTGKILPACDAGKEEYEDRYEPSVEAMISKNKDDGTREDGDPAAKKGVGHQSGSKKVESLENLVTLGVATHQTNRVESPISEKLDTTSLELKNEKSHEYGWVGENGRFSVKSEDSTVAQTLENSLAYAGNNGYNSSGITSLPLLLEILYSQDTTRNSTGGLSLEETSFDRNEHKKKKINVNNNFSRSSILPENGQFFVGTKNRYVDANVGGSKARGLADDKERIILPDADILDSQGRRFMNSMEENKMTSFNLQNFESDKGSIKNSNDVDNDAVIISLIEKDGVGDEKLIKQDRKLPEIYKIYETKIPYEGSELLENNQVQIPNPIDGTRENIHFKQKGRKLLAIQKSKYSRDISDQDNAQWHGKEEIIDEDDLIAEDEDAGPNVSSANTEYVDISDKRNEREKMKDNWDALINKVMNKNSGFEKRKVYDNVNDNDNDTPLIANRSNMDRLHFFDADKYINQMAKKISHYSNMHNFDDQDGHEKQLKDGQSIDKHTKIGNNVHNRDAGPNEIVNGSNRNFRIQDVDGSKDNSEIEEEVAVEEDVNDTPVKRRTISREKLKNFPGGKISINGRRLYPSMKVNHESDSLKSSGRKVAESSSVAGEDRSIDEKDIKLGNSTGNARFSVADENDSGFEISLNGKIHINGGTNGRPLSINIDAAPEPSNVNAPNIGSDSSSQNQLPDAHPEKVEKSPKIRRKSSKLDDKFYMSHDRNSIGENGRFVDKLRESMGQQKGNSKKLAAIFKRGSKIHRKNTVDPTVDKRYSKFMKTSLPKNYRNVVKLDSSWSSKFDQDSPLKILPVSAIVEKTFLLPRSVSRKRSERMKKSTAHRPDVKSKEFINNELDHSDIVEGSDVKIVKIIPVQFPEQTTRAVSGSHEKSFSTFGKEEKSGLITSELPKLEEVTVPVTEKAGKIQPIDVPENEDESDVNMVIDKNDWRYKSDSPKSWNPLSNPKPELCKSEFQNIPGENHCSNNHPPVNVKFMGILGIKKPDLNQTDYEMLDEVPHPCKANIPKSDESKDFDVVPLIRVKITRKKIDEPLIDKQTVLLEFHSNVTTESYQYNQDSNQREGNRVNSKQMGFPVSCQKCTKTATVKPQSESIGWMSSAASGPTKTDERNGVNEISKFSKFNHTMVEEIRDGPNQKHSPSSFDEFNYKNWLGGAHGSQREGQEKSYGNSDHEKWQFQSNRSHSGNREGNIKSDLRSRLNFTNFESGNRLQDKLDAGDSRSDLKIKVPELCDSKDGNLSPWCTTTLKSDDNTINNVMNNGKKTAQVENMLAIMNFMKKVENMIGGDNQRDQNNKNDGEVIHLERVVLVPENESQSEVNYNGEVQMTTDHIVIIGEGVKHDEVDGTETPKVKEITNNKFEESKNFSNSNRGESSSIPNNIASGSNRGNDKSFLFYRQQSRPSFLKSERINNDISSHRKNKKSKRKHPTENIKFAKSEPIIKKVKGRSSHLDLRSKYSDLDLDLDPFQVTNKDNNPPEIKSVFNQAPKLENFGLFTEENIKLDDNKNVVPEKLSVPKNSANKETPGAAVNSSKFMTSDPDVEFKIFGNESDVQRISNDSSNKCSANAKESENQDAESYNMRVHEKLKKEMMAKKLSEWQRIRDDLQSTSTYGSGGPEEQTDSKHNPKNLELGKELEEFQKLQEESAKREKELLHVVQKKINERLHDLEGDNLKEKSSQTKTDLTNLEPLIPLVLRGNNYHVVNDLPDVSNVNNHHSLANLMANLIKEDSEKLARERDDEKLIDDTINNDKILDLLSVPVDYSPTKDNNNEPQDERKVYENPGYPMSPDNSQASNMHGTLGLNKARELESEVTRTQDMKMLSNDERSKDVEEQAENIPNGKREVNKQIYISKELPLPRKGHAHGEHKHPRHPKVKMETDRKRKKKRRHKKKKKHKEKKGGKWWPFKRHLLNVPEDQDSRSINNFRAPIDTVSETKAIIVGSSEHQRRKLRSKRSSIRKKRQIRAGGAQIRGGQDCMDRRHPSNVNPTKYLESAHCLRFSDLWYSVYELENPIMEHTVYLQLYEKHTLPDGTTHWDDLTQGSMVRLGTFIRHQRDSIPTIVFTYSGAKIAPQKRAHNLNPSRERLLVPSPVAAEKAQKYPALKGGSGEYLVVGTNAISKDGNECDKAGVGFAAFAMQPDRCGHVKGTCLKNQPLAYWRHDMEAREAGRPGCYFLSNFASVPINPIKYNVSGSGSREFLGLEYHSPHVSAIDIEVRADYNAIVRVGSSGRVTEVYIDSTAVEHTIVTIVISNMGLASSPYQSRISDCPTGLPVSWTKAKGTIQVIPPQHDQRVTLDLYGQLYVNGFHCSVEVVNHHGELVAMRRIRVQKMDRCFCVWHCLCACVGSVAGLGCQPMSPEHYHAAGFQGPVPATSGESSAVMNTIRDVLIFSALVILLLLLLGMLKWLIGIFIPAVGRWGLDNLLEGSKMDQYFESELKCRCLVTDDDGIPVHPETGQRTVRICNRKAEFFLNLIFFLTYPIAICCNYAKRSLAATQSDCCPDESKTCLISEKTGCPKLICVNTYGDTRNSKMEAEDTQYVMNELKKSQESLQDPKRAKKTSRSRSTSQKSSHRNEEAENFVEDLLRRRVVFRNLTEPIGGLLVPSGTLYSVRGYFFNSKSGEYSFITPCPFKQHWLIDNCTKRPVKPARTYPSNLFMRIFNDACDVYESNEISLEPRGICINVEFLDDR